MSEKSNLDISIDPVGMKKSAKSKVLKEKRMRSPETLTGVDIDASGFTKIPQKSKEITPAVSDELKPLADVTPPIVSNTAGVVPVIQEGTPLGSGKVVEMIGQGGMTRVYKIWNEELEMYRAVKLVNQVFSGDTSDRFRTEAKICAKFDHPNIIHIYNVGKWYDIPYIEMEYIDGETLDYYIKKFGRLPSKISGAVSLKVAEALDHVHNAKFTLYGKEYDGIIHRDLKPSNIMIGGDGTVKLMDFGIARPVETGFHTAVDLNVVGTIQYFSPEQLDNSNIDHKTDIYALGAILYEMLSGAKTFPYTTLTSLVKMKTINSYKDLDTFDFALNKELKSIASKALQTDRGSRYETAREMTDALVKAFGNLTEATPQAIAEMYVADPHRMEAEEAKENRTRKDATQFEKKNGWPIGYTIGIVLVVIAVIIALIVAL